MVELGDQHRSILECYSRAVVHLRRQVSSNRFGLVFGAGLSKDFGIPPWGALVTALAEDSKVKGEDVLKTAPPRAGLPYRTEMLFEHFRQRCYAKAPKEEHHTRMLDFDIGARWRDIVRKHLYANVKGKLVDVLERHPYLKHYLPLIRRSHMTVTYNFDDFIEQCLLLSRGADPDSRGFESVTNPWTQFRRTSGIIYHPNGVVPKNRLETPSDRFVFSEASFADQLMGIFAGDQAGLVNHFSKHTCLLVGLSLEDETLRNVLMHSARSCPGNYHYYVRHLKPREKLSEEKQQAIARTNFKVYNLITIFLHNDGIRALGELIDVDACPSEEFCDFASEHGIPVQFRYYVTGPLGVGKSSTINHLRNLVVLDEWLDQRPAVLAKDWEGLSAREKREADRWILKQFRKKNDKLRNEREGIFVMDRGPLDPLSFTPDDELKNKAAAILSTLCPGSSGWEVEDGKVILLQGDGEELSVRMVLSKRNDYTAEKLEKMERQLGKVYGSEGVVRFSTNGLALVDVVHRLAEIMHLEDYRPVCDLNERLLVVKRRGTHAPQ